MEVTVFLPQETVLSVNGINKCKALVPHLAPRVVTTTAIPVITVHCHFLLQPDQSQRSLVQAPCPVSPSHTLQSGWNSEWELNLSESTGAPLCFRWVRAPHGHRGPPPTPGPLLGLLISWFLQLSLSPRFSPAIWKFFQVSYGLCLGQSSLSSANPCSSFRCQHRVALGKASQECMLGPVYFVPPQESSRIVITMNTCAPPWVPWGRTCSPALHWCGFQLCLALGQEPSKVNCVSKVMSCLPVLIAPGRQFNPRPCSVNLEQPKV